MGFRPTRNVSGRFEVTIHQAVWLFPACIAAHFLEEAFGFARWARSYISPRYTDAHWRKVHGLGLVSAFAASAVVSLWTRPVPIFLFTALFLTPMVFNSLFSSRYIRILPPVLPRDYVGTGALSRRVLALGVDLLACGSFERRVRAGSYRDRCRVPRDRPGLDYLLLA